MNLINTIAFLCIFLIAWYFVGGQVNRRKGIHFLKRIREKISMIGEDATIQWIGSSGFQIQVHKPFHPLRSFGILLLLQTREFPFIWIIQHIMNRRDVLVIKADLVSEPEREVEFWLKKTAFEKRIIRELRQMGRNEFKDLGKWSIAHGGSINNKDWALFDEIKTSGLDVQRVSIRKKSPHIVLIIFLKKSEDFRKVFEILRVIVIDSFSGTG